MTSHTPTTIVIENPKPRPVQPEAHAAAWIAARFHCPPATARLLVQHAQLGGTAARGR